jgi:hypothetical protein
MSESVILCEGFHDRAFWKGWLEHLGCQDPGVPQPGGSGRRPIYDPWKDKVVGGEYAFLALNGGFIRVVPCHGKSKIRQTASIRLKLRGSKALARLVINLDSDQTASGVKVGPSGLQLHDVLSMVRGFDPAAAPNAANEIELDGGATKVSLIRWEVTDPPAVGLPEQQTLERLVSAAIVAAYPSRAKSIQDWLDQRPIPPTADPKEHAWSHMAGWYAEHGCEFFYSNLWSIPEVVAQLETRLRSSGAWQIAEMLAS